MAALARSPASRGATPVANRRNVPAANGHPPIAVMAGVDVTTISQAEKIEKKA
jgi:hypothetical protein